MPSKKSPRSETQAKAQAKSQAISKIRWLQWATYDLKSGLGGVEMHARCVDRELRKLGVDAHISSNPEDFLDPTWDVIHTHGTGIQWGLEMRQSARFLPLKRRPVRIHGVHGETLGRMRACHEWTWVGGYLASSK